MFTRIFAGWTKQEKREFFITALITLGTVGLLHYLIVVFH